LGRPNFAAIEVDLLDRAAELAHARGGRVELLDGEEEVCVAAVDAARDVRPARLAERIDPPAEELTVEGTCPRRDLDAEFEERDVARLG
jgi:hypothetical protein